MGQPAPPVTQTSPDAKFDPNTGERIFPKFDPNTGAPIQPKFDPNTGQRIQ